MTVTGPVISDISLQVSGTELVTDDGGRHPVLMQLSEMLGVNGNPVLPNNDGSLSALHVFTPIAAAAYRAALVAADVIAAPGTVTCTKIAGGALPDGTYNVKVVAGNKYGRTTAHAGNTTITTETTNNTVRAAFAAVTGATFYDIYVSTDADPKFVGRITETQRASGILLTAVNVTGAGGTAGAVDVQAAGTGLQAGTTAAVNNAYVMPDDVGVDPTGKQYVDFDIQMSRTGDSVAPALIVLPFYRDGTGIWVADNAGPTTLSFGGAAASYMPLFQRVRADARGRKTHLAIASIAGTGASVTITAAAA